MKFPMVARQCTFFVRCISSFVAMTFLVSNVVFAAPQDAASSVGKEQEIITNPEKVVIPREFGLVKSKFIGNSGKLVVHIQDAHCNYEAQSNIAKILENLIKNYGLSLVSVEGADGFVDTSWFKAFPDEEVRREVAAYFMKKGEITGPEFLSITTDYPIKLFGAETRSYYLQNLNAFTSSYPLKDATEKYYNQVKAVLNRLKIYIYNDELKAFDSKTEEYVSKKLAFNDYVRYLQATAEKHRINLREYDNFFKLISVLLYEKKIDFKVVDKERSAVIDELSKKLSKDSLTELVTRSLSFKVGKISSAEFYEYLKAMSLANMIDIQKAYPNLYNYIIYNSVYSKIENEKLFHDITLIETAIKEKLFQNDDQRTLERLSRHIDTLLGLVNIKLLNGDYEYYKNHKEEFSHEVFADFMHKKTAQYGLAYEIEEPNEAVVNSVPKLEDFYSIAIKRDTALVDNTLDAMKKERAQISVLVTGGFHSEGITKLLEKQGISYMVVCPSITKDTPSPYIQILTNQRTPFEDILTGVVDTPAAKQGSVAAAVISWLLKLSERDAEALNAKVAPVGGQGLLERMESFKREAPEAARALGAAEQKLGEQRETWQKNPARYINETIARLYIGRLIINNISITTPEALRDIERSVQSAFPGDKDAIMGYVRPLITAAMKVEETARGRIAATHETTRIPLAGKGPASPGELTISEVLAEGRLTEAVKGEVDNFIRGLYTSQKRSGALRDTPVIEGVHVQSYRDWEAEVDRHNRIVIESGKGVLIPVTLYFSPGRGGAEGRALGLQLAHVSESRWALLNEAERKAVVLHELAHIMDANSGTLRDEEVIRRIFPIDNVIEKISEAEQRRIEDKFNRSINENNIEGAREALYSSILRYLETGNSDAISTMIFRLLPLGPTPTERRPAKIEIIEALGKIKLGADELNKLLPLLTELLNQRIESALARPMLEAILSLDQSLRVGNPAVAREARKLAMGEYARSTPEISDLAGKYITHRLMLNYTEEAKRVASSENDGFAVYIFVSSSQKEAEFWQKRFESTRGQILPRSAVIISVSEDNWKGMAGNGLGTLNAWRRAKERYSRLEEDIASGKSVFMMHMAGSGTRMQPLAVNNKSAIGLPGTVNIDGELVPLTVGEAVALQFGPLAASRGGRMVLAWGDQNNIPSENIDSTQDYLTEIFFTSIMVRDPKGMAIGNPDLVRFIESKGTVPSVGGVSGRGAVSQREKRPMNQVLADASTARNGSRFANVSLGFNSMRWELLQELLNEFSDELDAGQGSLNIDSELWGPLTSTKEEYATFMKEGALKDAMAEANKASAESRSFDVDELIAKRVARAEAHWDRIAAMKRRLTERYAGRFKVTGNGLPDGVGVLEGIDYGIDKTGADWWDWGHIIDYYNNVMKLVRVSPDIEGRWESERMRRYFRIESPEDWQRGSSLKGVEVRNSIVLGSTVKRGRIVNSVVIGTEAEELNVENAVVIGCRVYKLDARSAIAYGVIYNGPVELNPQDVIAAHYNPRDGRITLFGKLDPKIGDAYRVKGVYGNKGMTFDEASRAQKGFTKEEQESARRRVMDEEFGQGKARSERRLINLPDRKGIGADRRLSDIHDILTKGELSFVTLEEYMEMYGIADRGLAEAELRELASLENERTLATGEPNPLAGIEEIDNPFRENAGKIYRKIDIKNNQGIAYRSYDLRAVTTTHERNIPFQAEPQLFPAMMSEKFAYHAGRAFGTFLRLGNGGFNINKADIRDERGAIVPARLEAALRQAITVGEDALPSTWLLVSGGTRLYSRELKSAYARGLMDAGLRVNVVDRSEQGMANVRGLLAEDIKAGRINMKDAREFLEYARQFEENGITSTTDYYFALNFMANEHLGERDYIGGAHVTGSHNPRFYNGFKQANKLSIGEGIDILVSIDDGLMGRLKPFSFDMAHLAVPPPAERERQEMPEHISAVEIAYWHNESIKARARLGHDVWEYLLRDSSRSILKQKGGIRELLMVCRDINWDREDWSIIKKKLGIPFDIFPERPVLCRNRPFEKIGGLNEDHRAGSTGLSVFPLIELGVKVTRINETPDGNFPAGEPYPNLPEEMRGFMDLCRNTGLPGVARDEDGDRTIFFTEEGKMIQEDQLLAIQAEKMLRDEARKPAEERKRLLFIGEVKYSSVASRRIRALVSEINRELKERNPADQGIKAELYLGPVGFGYIKDEMRKIFMAVQNGEREIVLYNERKSPIRVDLTNAKAVMLAGELSGHQMEHMFAEDETTTLNLLETLAIAKERGRTLADLLNALPAVYATPELRPATEEPFSEDQCRKISAISGQHAPSDVDKVPEVKEAIVQGVREGLIKLLKDLGFEEAGKATIDNGECFIYEAKKAVPISRIRKEFVIQRVAINRVDGALIYFYPSVTGNEEVDARGRSSFVIRKSNTQPELIARVEGPTRKERDIISGLMFRMLEQYPGVKLSHDSYLLDEVLPILVYTRLPQVTMDMVDEYARNEASSVLRGIMERTISMDRENFIRLGYEDRDRDNFEKEFKRIHGVLDSMYTGGELPDEGDLREIIDLARGTKLLNQITGPLEKHKEGILAGVAGFGTEELYAELDKWVARYVNRFVRDYIKNRDVSEMREEDWQQNLQVGYEVLVGTRHLFRITGRVKSNNNILIAKLVRSYGPDKLEPLSSSGMLEVYLETYPAVEGRGLRRGTVMPGGMKFLAFDENGISNRKDLGIMVTTGDRGPLSTAESVSPGYMQIAETGAPNVAGRIPLQETTAEGLRAIEGVGQVTVNEETGKLEFSNPELQAAYKDRGEHDFGYIVDRLYSGILRIGWRARNIAYSMTHFGDLHAATTFGSYPLIPWNAVYVSTGSHSQGMTLDIKVMKVAGIQQIPVFNSERKLVSYRYQYLKPGDIAFSIPGTVDIYTVQTGGDQFADISIPLNRAMLGDITKLLGIEPDVATNPSFAEVLPAKGMPYIFYRTERGTPAVTVHPAYIEQGIAAPQRVKAYMPNIEGMALNEFLAPIMNPLTYNTPEAQDRLKRLASREFVMDVVNHIAGSEAEVEAESPVAFATRDEFVKTNDMAIKAFGELERRVNEGNPVHLNPVFMTGMEGYAWGRPILDRHGNPILEFQGVRTLEGAVAWAREHNVPETEVVAENWLGAGDIYTGTGYPLPRQALTLWPEIFGPESGLTRKVLASGAPLSVQTHGFVEQAIPLENSSAYIGTAREMSPEEFLGEMMAGEDETGFALRPVMLAKGIGATVRANEPHAYGVGCFFETKAVTPEEDRSGTRSLYDRLKLTDEQRAIVRGLVARAERNEISWDEVTRQLTEDRRLRGKDGKPLVRPNKDVLTQPAAQAQETIRRIADSGYLRPVDEGAIQSKPILAGIAETEKGAEAGRFEIMGAEDKFVTARYTVQPGAAMKADTGTLGKEHILFVSEGRVKIVKESGEEFQELGEEKGGESAPIPANIGRYSLVSAGSVPAVVYTSYNPGKGERTIISAFQAMQNELARITASPEKNEFTIWVPKELYRGESFESEKSFIKTVTHGLVNMRQYQKIDDVGKPDTPRDVVVVMADRERDLDRLDRAILSSVRILPVSKKYADRVMTAVRELEAAGVILGNTEPKDITDKASERARDLARLMARMTSTRVDTKDLAALLSARDIATGQDNPEDRLKKLVDQLLITMPIERHEIDKGLEGRRQVLWSV
ncbi:MAG: hypothetical protein WC515_07490 [Candidatus Omnitrophota bacterium]